MSIVEQCSRDGSERLRCWNVVCEANGTGDIGGVLSEPTVMELSGDCCEIENARLSIACAAAEVGRFNQFSTEIY